MIINTQQQKILHLMIKNNNLQGNLYQVMRKKWRYFRKILINMSKKVKYKYCKSGNRVIIYKCIKNKILIHRKDKM